jgi:FO synthase
VRWPASSVGQRYPAEATALLDARGAQLDELCSVAARVRDAGLVAAGRPGGGDLLPQGVHPGHQPAPRPLPLLHVRGIAGAYGSRDKDSAIRLRVLEDAGRLSVPFTSGLLVGIGEILPERAETIFALRANARRYGALQEVLVQNFRAKPDTAMRHADHLDLDEYRAAIAVTRIVMGPKDADPGAAQPGGPQRVRGPAGRGRRRLGRGLPAHTRPREPRAPMALPRAAARDHRLLRLRAAPTAHRASGVRRPGRAVARPPRLRSRRRPGRQHRPIRRPGPSRRTPAGLSWQEPDGGFASVGTGTGRTELHASIDTEGRTKDRRDGFGTV